MIRKWINNFELHSLQVCCIINSSDSVFMINRALVYLIQCGYFATTNYYSEYEACARALTSNNKTC